MFRSLALLAATSQVELVEVKVDHVGATPWYVGVLWIAVFVLGGILLLVLVAMAATGSGSSSNSPKTGGRV